MLKLATFLVLAAGCTPVIAQTPSDVKDGRVAVVGENPVIRLASGDGASPSTNVSFWRVFQSPVGMGHVCNGRRASGHATPRMRGSRQSSSAFLAFAETWLK